MSVQNYTACAISSSDERSGGGDRCGHPLSSSELRTACNVLRKNGKRGDRDLFASVYGWIEHGGVHASAVMLPDGRTFGRTVDSSGRFSGVDTVAMVGTDIQFWSNGQVPRHEAFVQRHRQLFGEETTVRLRSLRAAVVGCSGTGSPLIEMLARLGVGGLVLVDPDRIEVHNLNRIYNATYEDAVLGRFKTEVMGRAIARMGLGTEVKLISRDLATQEAVRAVASCDVIFGCMDGVRGRSLLDTISVFYSLPYFDVGIRLDAMVPAASARRSAPCITWNPTAPDCSTVGSTQWLNCSRKHCVTPTP